MGNQPPIAKVFKTKAVELVNQLQAKFPALMFLPCQTLKAMPGTDLMDMYVETVSKPYRDRIVNRDETFFLNVPDAEIVKATRGVDVEVDLPMLKMVRSLWGDLDKEDKDVVWDFFGIFEQLVDVQRPATDKARQ